MEESIIPTNEHLLISEYEAEENIAGIVLPEELKEKPQYGNVLQAATDCTDEMKSLVGKNVFYKPYAGVNLKFNKEMYLLIKQDDIIGYVKEE
jgi:chaperonin GroES